MGKIPSYTALATPAADDLLIIEDVSAGVTKKIEKEDLVSGIEYSKLLSTIFIDQLTSASNAGTAGGTNYYINLGGIKLLWGSCSGVNAGSGGAFTVTLPGSFFTNVRATFAAPISSLGAAGGTNNVYVGGGSTATTSTLYIQLVVTAGSSTNTPLSWLVIGS